MASLAVRSSLFWRPLASRAAPLAYRNDRKQQVHDSAQPLSGNLAYQMDKTIPVTMIPGDGVGPELMHSVKEVFKAGGVPVKFDELFFSELNPYLSVSAEKVVESVVKNGVCLMHYLKTPDTSLTGELGSLNMKFRRGLDLFANVVHVKSLPGVRTRHKGLDFIIIREQTEGEYSALEHESVPGVVESYKIVTREKSRRIAKFAFDYATKYGRKKVTAVHKANIMKLADGLFLRSCEEISKLYPNIEFNNMIIDNTTMQLVSNPHQFDVLVMPNLYGTIIDNLAAGLIGGAGVCAGASYSSSAVVYEPGARHTFSEAVGRNLANPTAMLLCSARMLDHLNFRTHAVMVRNAVSKVLLDGKVDMSDCVRELELEANPFVLRVHQEILADVGGVVWDAALCLAKFLDWQRANKKETAGGDVNAFDVAGKTVVELGSGTGIVGLTAAALGAEKVYLTDLEDFVDLSKKNAIDNGLEKTCSCQVLDWESAEFPPWAVNPDVLLFSDCVYYEKALHPLISTVKRLAGPSTTVLMSYEDRSECFENHGDLIQRFFAALESDFSYSEIPCDEWHPDFRAPDMRLVRLRKKE